MIKTGANPLTDALCREGMRRAAQSLRRAYEQGDDAVAREDMALTSLFGGLALANAKRGGVRGNPIKLTPEEMREILTRAL